MNSRQRDRRDFWQNIIIVVLSLTSVLLVAQTQLYNLGSTAFNEHFNLLLEVPVQADLSPGNSSVILAAPVHVAVSGAYGRYGDMDLITTDDSFRPLGDLLKEALGSARTSTACTQAEFLQALNTTSIYYDFLSPLPMSILGELTGTTVTNNIQVQRLILSTEGSRNVQLYIWDRDGNYYSCDTAVSRGDLESTVDRYELGNAVFAFELADADVSYTTVDPCSLFLSDSLPALPLLQAEHALSDLDLVLTALHFNPRTNYRYPQSDGTEVVVEGERSLRIRPNGTILYHSGGETALSIDSAIPDFPTAQEAAAGTGALLQQLLPSPSDAQLYLQSIQQSDTSTILQFGYHMSGVPIRFSDGSAAAEVTLTGNTISALSLQFRQYTVSGEDSLLLPLRQALAIAASDSGAELSIGYADNGAAKLSACWLAN